MSRTSHLAEFSVKSVPMIVTGAPRIAAVPA
jgi:hypothetical protein